MAYQQEKPQQPMQPQFQPQQQQFQATPGMQVSPGGNRNANNLPMDAEGREWSTGLFDCFSQCGNCILGSFCPCMLWAQNKSRYEHLNNTGRPHPSGGDLMNGDCFMHGCLTACCGLGWVFQIGTRTSIRARYSIKGSGVGDCCSIFCCTPCALVQEASELELEEQSMAGKA